MATNLTSGCPARLIITFVLPMMLGNLFQLLYPMAGMTIVGRTLGVDALAGVGLTGDIGFLFMGPAVGLSQGFSILCAQRYDAGSHAGRDGLSAQACCSAQLSLACWLAVPCWPNQPYAGLTRLPTPSSLRWTICASRWSAAAQWLFIRSSRPVSRYWATAELR